MDGGNWLGDIGHWIVHHLQAPATFAVRPTVQADVFLHAANSGRHRRRALGALPNKKAAETGGLSFSF
ncbi:hypothetical protein JQ604_00490 [Bradyrhizobium jicamae]|uniref:hypothetical protein n=1 Tax=Bradyrhizobium jicamae TaxID=280332 RepID=UPI001BA5139B|nr:hypothetical protein [Bradyrhizobium jicamae]MBR0750655.1 hypothetical protein [Bradyrhizobium jicamae]